MSDPTQDKRAMAAAKALYEHWVAEDFANEYVPWEQCPNWTLWLERATVALDAADKVK